MYNFLIIFEKGIMYLKNPEGVYRTSNHAGYLHLNRQ